MSDCFGDEPRIGDIDDDSDQLVYLHGTRRACGWQYDWFKGQNSEDISSNFYIFINSEDSSCNFYIFICLHLLCTL